MTYLNSKEQSILECISRKTLASQRDIAKITGISLGLINVILKRLIQSGYVKVNQLNKKKLEYLPSPSGALETARRQYETATSMIQGYKKIQNQLSKLFKELHSTGYNYFSIHGDGELKDVVEAVLRSSLEDAPVTFGREHRVNPQAVVLNLTAGSMTEEYRGDVVNVLERVGPFL